MTLCALVRKEAGYSLPRQRFAILAALLIIVLGLAVRIVPWAGFTRCGFDEVVYRDTVLGLDLVGLWHYPAVCDFYIEKQSAPGAMGKVPPTRALYLASGWVVKRLVFDNAPPAPYSSPEFALEDPSMRALRITSTLFSCLFFMAGGLIAARMFGPWTGLGVLALMAASPLQIHMAQHAFIDGFFAFWATLCVWLLWENLQRPQRPRWLAAYGIALALMVLTKENALFVYIGLCGAVAVNRWARFGTVTRELLGTMFLGPLAGVVILIQLTGGLEPLIRIFELQALQAMEISYVVQTADGPWHRYLMDLLIVTPLVFCLALGGLFTSVKGCRPLLFLVVFTAFSYAVMCNIRYGLNLRFATIWELPLCALAVAQVYRIAQAGGRWRGVAGALILLALCAYGLRQYSIFFVDGQLYELDSKGLLEAAQILKKP